MNEALRSVIDEALEESMLPRHYAELREGGAVTVPPDEEVRSTDPETGAQKGVKLARFDLIPPGPLEQLAEHYGRGAIKYGEGRNWERGYAWGKSFAAMMRHAWAWWGGEDIDPETGSNHMISVAWHALALVEWSKTHPEKDDRPKAPSE